MQKLTSLAPIMQHAFSQVTTPEKTSAYHTGFAMGRKCSEEDQADGQQLTTAEEVWTFLKGEISPRVVARTYEYDDALSLPHLPIEQQIGFIVGYLSDMFAPQPEVVVSHHKGIHVPFTDSVGFPLDA